MDFTTTTLDAAYTLEARLAAHQPALRKSRGVYFTPRPLASYLVRSVAHILRSEFDLSEGLATHGLRIVDPACGSGVFLREVLRECGSAETRPSLLGFDVLPEACEAARKTVAECGPQGAVKIVELNPLEADDREMAALLVDAACRVVHDNEAVPPGRRDLLVILGNPPWSNFGRQNNGSWIRGLLAEYKVGLDETKHNLADDYIKFVRWGQNWIDQAGAGVLAFVTSNTHLAGLTHRVMRRSLLESFHELYFYNLHGSAAKGDRTSSGAADENLFGVKSGVALNLLIKRGRHAERACYYAELRGTRESKLEMLAETDISTTRWMRLAPTAPMHYFVSTHTGQASEYKSWPRLDEIFVECISGVQTKNDALYTAFTRKELAERMRTHLAIGDVPFDESCIVPYMTAPFDMRWIYYDQRLLGRARYSVMRHMLRPNAGLVFMRQSTTPGEYDHFLAVSTLVSDRVFHSAHGAPFLAPLYRYEESGRISNLRGEMVERLASAWQMRFAGEGRGDLQETFGPEDMLHYVYAIVHGAAYRRKYDAQLRTDFPRVPLYENVDLVRKLCALGRAMVVLHTSSNPAPTATAHSSAVAVGSGLNDAGVFRLGGCKPVRRWLKQRKGRELSSGELAHYESLVRIARETSRLRQEIDAAFR